MDNQGVRLKRLLKLKGITNKELAEKMKLSRNYISILIKNPEKINNKFIYSIKKVIPDLNENWLINGEGKPLISNNFEEEGLIYKKNKQNIATHQNTLLAKVNRYIKKLEAIEEPDLIDLQQLDEALDLKKKIQKELDLLQ
ncbi:helix-turn-helix domain-containing protein [Lutibacter aestuarii]|uniref:Helix-turn-helix domain-containing protein n=1 Tax=Lutibacter aestuarii TaxID=861111 RepID=A0ABW2ZA16_9FLAO